MYSSIAAFISIFHEKEEAREEYQMSAEQFYGEL